MNVAARAEGANRRFAGTAETLLVEIQHHHSLKGLYGIWARNLQGAILASKKNWEKAEPLLVESYDDLRRRLADLKLLNRWLDPHACERLVALYESRDQPDTLAKWKAELENVRGKSRSGKLAQSTNKSDSGGKP